MGRTGATGGAARRPGDLALAREDHPSGAPEAFERPTVILRPSTRRTRTVSAYREGDSVVVLVPARLSRAEQERWAEKMVLRITAKEARTVPGDDALVERCRRLAARHLPEIERGLLEALQVRWSPRQTQRWASCTPIDVTIRVSDRLRGVPEWVLDSVLVHELAHLVEANHSPRFHALVARYVRTAEARTWLEGYGLGLSRPATG